MNAGRQIETRAFKMQLNPGMKAEYKKRHDELWPDLRALLKEAGICNYHIFLDEEHHSLFAVMQCPTDFDGDALAEQKVMKLWWDHMADIMATHPNNQPIAVPLESMFFMA